MSDPDNKPELTALLEAGRHMLDCANAGDWESVDELQAQCHELSKDIFSGPVCANETAAAAAAIRELLSINESIVALGGNAREVCLKNAGSLKHSREAIKEYTTNAG